MTTYRSIAIVGEAGSGKTTLAREIARLTGGDVKSFADPLRDIVAHIDPLVEHEVSWNDAILELGYTEAKEEYPLVRQYLQRTGDAIRGAQPDFFVELMGDAIRRTAGHIVVDDVRFENEYELLRCCGFLVAKIVRGGEGSDLHESESWPRNFHRSHVLVVNDGDMESLKAAAAILTAAAKETVSVGLGEVKASELEVICEVDESGGKIGDWNRT